MCAYEISQDEHRYLSGSELVTSGVYWTHWDNLSDVSTSETASRRQRLLLICAACEKVHLYSLITDIIPQESLG